MRDEILLTLLTEPSKVEQFPVFLCGGSQGQFYHFRDHTSQPRVRAIALQTRKPYTGSKWEASIVDTAKCEVCRLDVLLGARDPGSSRLCSRRLHKT